MHRQANAGYSLVEMMVVIAIIGVLAVALTDTTKGFVRLAKINIARGQLQDLSNSIQALRLSGESERTLIQVTGNTCSICAGPNSQGPTFQKLGYAQIPLDPWGQPYMIDENEGEGGPADCRYDALYSSGPDQVWVGFGDGDDVAGDDIIVRVPHLIPHAGCANDPITGG